MKYLGHTILFLLLVSVSQAQKLQQYCKFTPQHTLCRTTGLGKTCGKTVPSRGVSEQDAAVIVAQHNQYRAMIALGQEKRGKPGPQPKAADMMQMEWDEELAVVAQRHADQCIFEHDCSDCRKVERFPVGQNLFISFQSDMETTIHWPRAMAAWYDEVDLFSSSGVSSYNFEAATGHFTQMVWSETRYVGCGFTMFVESGWYKKLYTCNYGPGGNVIFTPMYKIGDPCSSCPAGTSCSLAYPGLCTPNSDTKSKIPAQGLGKARVPNSRGKKIIQAGPRRPPKASQPFQWPKDSGFGEFGGFGSFGEPDFFEQQRLKNNGTQRFPKTEDIQNFLMKFGKNSQVIRTSSLDSVRSILSSLPKESQPLVFFRSNMGTIRQLNNRLLSTKTPPTSVPRRSIRSTATPARQSLNSLQIKRTMLLSCQDVTKPCPVVALSGNWTHGKDNQTNVVRSLMPSKTGGQIVLGQTIPPPKQKAVCVTMSHAFKGFKGATLPQVHVGVWPLGQVLLQEEVSEVSIPEKDGWMMTKVAFSPIRHPFMVVLSVDQNPNPQPVEIALRGFMVTEGLCN